MKIAVLLKRVPDTGVSLRVNPDGTDIVSEGVAFVTNPYDEYALEEAVRISETKGDCEIIAVSIGDASATDVLRNALAVGAHRAVLLKHPDYKWLDPKTAGEALADFLAEEKPDLVLMGKQAVDDNAFATGFYLAKKLNYTIAAYAIKIELQENSALITRETDWGTEKVKIALPGIITCEKGLNEPRLPGLRGIMAAKRKPIEEKEIQADSLMPRPKLSMPPEKQAGVKVQEEFPADVDKLMEFLREHML